jgi:hypothetical protein
MRAAVLAVVVALAVFCGVQDSITAEAARHYARMHRDAVVSRTPATVTVDEIMTPAIRRGVVSGLLSAGAVLVVGLAAAQWYARRL